MDGYGRYPHPGPGGNIKVIKKVSIQREPELKRTENAWKPSKVEAGLTTDKTEEETETEVSVYERRAVRSYLHTSCKTRFLFYCELCLLLLCPIPLSEKREA